MYPEKLKEIILEGESSTVEFKRKFTTPEKIAKELSAFANTIGGWLLIGIDDDGTIVGVESEKGDDDLIDIACGFYISPPLPYQLFVVNMNGKDLIVVNIEESSRKPHKVVLNPDAKKPQYQTYIRHGEQSVIASSEMTRVMAARSNPEPLRLIIGDKEKRLFAFLERNGRATVQDFARITNISRRRAERLMVRLVRASVLQIHHDSGADFFTLTGE